jgi:ADP-ribose pyrophosphatase
MSRSSDDVEIIDVMPAYQGHFKINRYRYRYRQYRGGWSKPAEREVFERGHSVAVLLYDPALDQVVLIEQVRLPALIGGGPARTIEVAAGVIDPGETVEDVAYREVREETGLEIRVLLPMCSYFASPGGTSEHVTIFAGRVDAAKAGGIHGADHDEDIKVVVLNYTDAMAALEDGRIRVASTVISLQWLALHRERLRALWV